MRFASGRCQHCQRSWGSPSAVPVRPADVSSWKVQLTAVGKRGVHVLGIDSVGIATCGGPRIRPSGGGRRQDGKNYRMMRNSDHSCGDSTFGKKDIHRSTECTSRKRGERIQVMLKNHCSLADGMAIDLYQ